MSAWAAAGARLTLRTKEVVVLLEGDDGVEIRESLRRLQPQTSNPGGEAASALCSGLRRAASGATNAEC